MDFKEGGQLISVLRETPHVFLEPGAFARLFAQQNLVVHHLQGTGRIGEYLGWIAK